MSPEAYSSELLREPHSGGHSDATGVATGLHGACPWYACALPRGPGSHSARRAAGYSARARRRPPYGARGARRLGELALPGAEIVRERLAEDAVLVVSELVTNAVVHAGTDVELLCRLEITDGGAVGAVVVEVSDHHPSRAVREEAAERAYGTPEYGRGLRLVATLSEAWGITYRTGIKTVWARLPVDGGWAATRGSGSRVGWGLKVGRVLRVG